MRNAELLVTLQYGDVRDVAATEIVPPFFEQFRPVDKCTDAFMAAVTSGMTEEQYSVHMKMREDYAKILAAELSKHIVNVMKSRDTVNGYPVEKHEK